MAVIHVRFPHVDSAAVRPPRSRAGTRGTFGGRIDRPVYDSLVHALWPGQPYLLRRPVLLHRDERGLENLHLIKTES